MPLLGPCIKRGITCLQTFCFEGKMNYLFKPLPVRFSVPCSQKNPNWWSIQNWTHYFIFFLSLKSISAFTRSWPPRQNPGSHSCLLSLQSPNHQQVYWFFILNLSSPFYSLCHWLNFSPHKVLLRALQNSLFWFSASSFCSSLFCSSILLKGQT